MRRVQRRSCIINGEGKAEHFFLKHLKRMYINEHSSNICIPSLYVGGAGGSPLDVAIKMLNGCHNRVYDYGAILVDGDTLGMTCGDLFKRARSKVSRDLRKAIPRQCVCIVASPCIEGMLLDVAGVRVKGRGAAVCKDVFSRKFRRDAHRLTDRDWALHFPRELLEGAVGHREQLDALISIFSGKFDVFE